ncbi:GntR family transcriptional regulator [Poseidonocella sedimentorum]|uniref:DNA-binding transcriptional regulator, GntR family n=1 Tax=Poseidonocella sedimentorum TaxID=871652 RepID=A0A1I6EDE2_9RHOB|nr:GntR family transcriptional regulator [Poseidonocella sedimentorum]SFR15541.1 DNA-binding transcriptional regulator, GntR family [Poseidonocella sedimentorum]
MRKSENPTPPGDPAPSAGLQGQSVYARLCDEIRSGALAPGARLLETDIAARLQTSRTPVREAIRRLEAEGLVDHQPRTGAIVRVLDYSEIMELYEMRTVLEGTAARLAARAASPMEIEELKSIHQEMIRSPGDSAGQVLLNRQFHTRLLEAARNRFLLRAAVSVEKTLLILGPSAMEFPERMREAFAEHGAVIEALEARDGAGAELAMRRHMENAQLARLRMLRHATPEEAAP